MGVVFLTCMTQLTPMTQLMCENELGARKMGVRKNGCEKKNEMKEEEAAVHGGGADGSMR